MRALNLVRFDDYLEWIRKDTGGDEITLFVDSISTNVTSFFRESQHFTYLKQTLASWRGEGQSRFRIWSAACSSGEEPYSIAMTMMDALDRQDVDWRILATDISTRVLQHAMAGVYTKDKMDTVPAPYQSRFCQRVPTPRGEGYAMRPELKDKIVFRQMNLSQAPYPLRGPLDVIFCRNVMIYFDNTIRCRLLQEFYRLLRPGGILLVGHAESLTGLSSGFKPIRASIYCKP
jgi:chemotaxis protein methyltransferase CheR